MQNSDYITTEVEKIFSMLDSEELPETHRFLASIMDDEGFVNASPYDIASNLVECDKPNELSEVLVEFISEMFETAIADGNCDAMNDLGAQYYNGSRCFEQSFERALYYYNMAAENGSRHRRI